jgi:hypothetical protein
MSYGFMGFGTFLFALPILIGQWVGIIGLGKLSRNGAWWCMMSGISCSTLGVIGSTLFMVLMFSGMSSGGLPGGMSAGTISVIAASSLSGLGSLLFAIGFALHGLHASRAQQRIGELEAIATAQGEELDRQRATYGSSI